MRYKSRYIYEANDMHTSRAETLEKIQAKLKSVIERVVDTGMEELRDKVDDAVYSLPEYHRVWEGSHDSNSPHEKQIDKVKSNLDRVLRTMYMANYKDIEGEYDHPENFEFIPRSTTKDKSLNNVDINDDIPSPKNESYRRHVYRRVR